MICIYCHRDTAIWTGPLTALTGTRCTECGAVDCVAPGTNERDPEICWNCGTVGKPHGCACGAPNSLPPCWACENGHLKCPECGEEWSTNDV